MLLEFFHKTLQLLIYFLSALSIFVIVWGTVLQFLNFLKIELAKSKFKNKAESMENITTTKNYLGIYILFGLELLIGADIIESILDPTLNHMATLAVIVLVRTVISYFLSKEIASNGD